MSMNWMTTMEMTLMRDILFRGKRIDNGEWVLSGNIIRFIPENGEGLIFIPAHSEPCICDHDENDNIIAFEKGMFYKVDTKTVGQYTGLHDKHGKRIWEGDIVRYAERRLGGEYVSVVHPVTFDEGGFCAHHYFLNNWLRNGLGGNTKLEDIEVIGNIHDNQELLERGE